MARGYKTRWFVLQHGKLALKMSLSSIKSRLVACSTGHLSYYRDQEEEGRASRGTISMIIATVDLAGDKSTFTIGTSLGKSPRWFLKGNHPVEAMQWVSALRTSIDIVKNADSTTASSGLPSLSGGGEAFIGSTRSANASHSSLLQPSDGKGLSLSPFSGTPEFSNLNRTSTAGTTHSATSDYDPMDRTPSPHGTEASILGDDDDSSRGVSSNRPPHEENFALLANSVKGQVAIAEQLLNSLKALENDRDGPRRMEIIGATQRSLRVLANMLDTHIDQVVDREKWFNRRAENEREVKRMWEENMRSVVHSQSELEHQLAVTQQSNSRRKRALKDLKASVLADVALADGSSATPHGDIGTPETARPVVAPLQTSATTPSGAIVHSRSLVQMASMDDIVSDTSDDEDFYDAVESGALPIRVESPIASPGKADWPKDFKDDPEMMARLQSYEGYKNLRDRLPITSDERPPVSLWAILKGSIGKDLTKISFPVYFNGQLCY